MALRPPPTTYSSTDDARILPKPKFPLFRRARKASRTLSIGTSSPPNVSLAALPLAGPDPLIDINPNCISSALDDDQDQYRWAVVYENQRGLKIFSSLYYSFSSLLPTDPSPFTVPTSKRSKQPDVSLAVYPLPDGAWRWLSPWMIDMRSDSGEVQHDGFEYNFMFRTHKWHPEAGAMSWVRRRRWIRLMMRPAKSKDPTRLTNTSAANTPITPTASIIAPGGARNRYSVASSVPPSSVAEEDSFDEWTADEVWLSDNSDVNWERCHIAMRRAGRDGRILELWRRWLGDVPPEPQDRMGRRKQWTEDDDPPPGLEVPSESPVPDPYTPPPIANIVPVLRNKGDAILQSFIYPESRARFLQMLERAGVLGELNSDPGAINSSSEVDFWSYLNKWGERRIIAEDSTVERK
ncbi:hypothetical protein C8F04DRAFT_1393095 [Mycena alexandri]|uniref:TECPR1-like DysF domain-containing protein n=1 Tax=Mycena alexandri TaxID=1745969 RepID=A0AAD6T1X3_9AGAR|nr:hypothetical protein C8F04DRAFT_1393095 [Mycena alexandri]